MSTRLECAPTNAGTSLADQASGIEAPDRNQYAEDDGLRARRAAGNVDVDGENPVDAPGARVTLPDDAARRRTRSHRDHDARSRDRFDRAADGGFQVCLLYTSPSPRD